MAKGNNTSSDRVPLFAANSARGIVCVDGNPLRLIFREGSSLETKKSSRWGLIGGKVGRGECFLFRLEMEVAQEAQLRIAGGRQTIRAVTTLHTPEKIIRDYPVWKIKELGFDTRGLHAEEKVDLSNPLTVVFYCRADGDIPDSREGRKLCVIDFSEPDRLSEQLRLVKPRHREITRLWVRHELFGEHIPPFIEYGKADAGSDEALESALADGDAH